MLVLLKSGLSDSREWAVEDTEECRSTSIPRCRKTLSKKRGRVYFMTDVGPEVTTNYKNSHGLLNNYFYCFLSHCWQIHFLLLWVIRLERRSILRQRLIGTHLVLLLSLLYDFYSDYDLCYCIHFWVILLLDLGISWA